MNKTDALRANVSVRAHRRPVDGVLLLDKPVGISSNAALQQAKRLYRAEKAGHTGTLDPLASGLLPICFGEATKFANMLLDAEKAYVATIRFGVRTTTGDAEGATVAQRRVDLSQRDVEVALPHFVGRIAQVPPRYAALKYRGRNFYEYARAGIDIPRTAREVEIIDLQLEAWQAPDARLRVRCGKGAYMRALAEDIGVALGCGAHIAALRRIAAGGFEVVAARTLDALALLSDVERDLLLLPVDALVDRLPRVDLDTAAATRFGQGQAIACADLGHGAYRVYAAGVFVGVATAAAGCLRPRRLIATAAAETAPDNQSLES